MSSLLHLLTLTEEAINHLPFPFSFFFVFVNLEKTSGSPEDSITVKSNSIMMTSMKSILNAYEQASNHCMY